MERIATVLTIISTVEKITNLHNNTEEKITSPSDVESVNNNIVRRMAIINNNVVRRQKDEVILEG